MHELVRILHDYTHILALGKWPVGSLGGLALTLFLAAAGLLGAFPLAVLTGVVRTCPWTFLRWISAGYVQVIRGIPILMLIFWSYFAVPLLSGYSVTGVTTMIFALIIYETAFLGEIVRAGIEALPRGQVEASRSLGLGYFRTLRHVVLPQALFNMLPSILNQFINLVKNTSLAYIIGVEELTYFASEVNNYELDKPMLIYGLLAAIYFVLCFSLSRLVGVLEKHVRRSRNNIQIDAALAQGARK